MSWIIPLLADFFLGIASLGVLALFVVGCKRI